MGRGEARKPELTDIDDTSSPLYLTLKHLAFI